MLLLAVGMRKRDNCIINVISNMSFKRVIDSNPNEDF